MSFERLDNATPMAVHAEVLDDRSGREVLTVIAKMTWTVSAEGAATLAAKPSPVRERDVWTGEPGSSSLRFPSDLCPEKPGTDVILLGTAYSASEVRLRLEAARGALQKSARVLSPAESVNLASAGFGPIAAHQAPRADFAGTYDDAWRRDRAPLPPADRDPRFYCCAAPGLWIEEPLRGDEPVEIFGATPAGLWRFRLPFYAPVFTCVLRGDARACATHLDTFLIDADAGRVELTFRTSLPAPRKLQAIDRVKITDGARLPDSAWTEACERPTVDDDDDRDDDEEEAV